jgi:hypothetical protein
MVSRVRTADDAAQARFRNLLAVSSPFTMIVIRRGVKGPSTRDPRRAPSGLFAQPTRLLRGFRQAPPAP